MRLKNALILLIFCVIWSFSLPVSREPSDFFLIEFISYIAFDTSVFCGRFIFEISNVVEVIPHIVIFLWREREKSKQKDKKFQIKICKIRLCSEKKWIFGWLWYAIWNLNFDLNSSQFLHLKTRKWSICTRDLHCILSIHLCLHRIDQ